jgi:hypothetical protein
MAVAPAAIAAPADYHSAQRAAQTKVYDLRSPDARDVFTTPAAQVDLRTPDAVDTFVAPSATTQSEPSDGGFNWGIVGIIFAAFAACGALVVMLRRHLDTGRPLGV